MSRKLIAIAAVLAATAGTVAAIATAGPASAKQRIAIEVTGGSTSEPFVLTPLASGAAQRDSGTATFCCWTAGSVLRDGQTLDTGNPQMTLVGKLGTLITRNRIVWMDIPGGEAIYTGTWKVVRGTGAYSGLTGSGIAAGLMLANGNVNARLTGSLSPK